MMLLSLLLLFYYYNIIIDADVIAIIIIVIYNIFYRYIQHYYYHTSVFLTYHMQLSSFFTQLYIGSVYITSAIDITPTLGRYLAIFLYCQQNKTPKYP